MSLDWIYYAISWILLAWHSAWDAIGIPDGAVLGTNWAWILAIIFLVVTVRVILFPVFVKQIKSQRAMQALQPQVKALQEKHKGDRETLQKEMMELYRKEKANPLMGCLPMFLQIPVFLGLFHVLRRLNPDPSKNNKDIYGWTVDQFNSASDATLFTAPIASKFGSTAAELAQLGANGTVVKIMAGVLVLVMMGTTYLTSRQMILKTGWAEDPQQRMIQRLMLYGIPLSLLVSGAIFPIGVIIYWVTNNLFTLGQQQWVLRKFPPPVTATSAKPGTSARNGAQPAKTSGLFGRSKPAAAPPPPAAPKIAGPKPGAKPVNPKKGRPAKRQG
ncbi:MULTISPECIES: membrane protein insertase YidC [unclassified Micromonospora]|uniref:membrane protein insertase YidC n=1 Tax=unclassified Micromonospora TaxID=2617518 RepID=UPI0022B6AFF0|nr:MULTISPECIES: membrane protein insertase YidC [unclassified Micromonospora]MCZ7421758.1 membrane protein insertase YidC [Verrucosispora sp. WMMA2121]WBB93571.1 membrane protein insertase YidC [Verrucosispora sp. WMMC514]